MGDVATSPYGENQLRDRVPVKGEYQRYPGHPAMTCLSPVFGRDQIFTEMVDLIRMGTNAYSADPAVPPRYEYAPARQMPDAVSGETQIVPLVPPPLTPGAGTKGFGRFPTITEAALIFYATSDKDGQPDKTQAQPDGNMRVVLVLEPFSPTSASWTWSPLVRYVVKGLNNFVINGQGGVFQNNVTNLVTSRCGYGSGGAHNTAHTGTFAAFRYCGAARATTARRPSSPPARGYSMRKKTIRS